MRVQPIQTEIFKEGSSLRAFVAQHVSRISEKSILVVTSKIVALAERRTAIITDARAKERLIRRESDLVIPVRRQSWLVVRDGVVMMSAGIDESNANGKLILLPKDPFRTARLLRKALRNHYGVENLGVLITDSRTMPLRAGITGRALGYAGFRGFRSYRGKTDLFGRPFTFSRVNAADSLAASAVLVMGEGDERQPLALLTGTPVEFFDGATDPAELRIDARDDMYGSLLARLYRRRR